MSKRLSHELTPGDVFTVDPPDPESPVRVCLTNDKENGLRFGWPNNKDYWCHMGTQVPVWAVDNQTISRLAREHVELYERRVQAGEQGQSSIRLDECRHYLALWKMVEAKGTWARLTKAEQREVRDALEDE